MKAEEARLKYFESYIEFEQEVRKLARRIGNDYKTKNKTLSEIIKDIGVFNYEKSLNIRVSYLKGQNKVRNWLAHSPKSLMIPKKYLKYMENITILIKELKQICVIEK